MRILFFLKINLFLLYMKIISFIILIFLIVISIHSFKIFKLYDKRVIHKRQEYIHQNDIDISNDNIEIQHQPYNYTDVYEYGIYRTHPLKHPNDIDYNLSELSDNMTILDAGCGMLGPSIYFADKLPDLKIHALTRANDKMKSEINTKIKNNKLNGRIILHFNDFNEINKKFRKNTFDRILFIESISYSNDIINLLKICKSKLKSNGKIYIRTLTIPKTKNSILTKSYNRIQQKLEMKLYYHENMVYFLQNSGFKNITYTSIPFAFSENLNNPIFLLSLQKLGVLSVSNILSSAPIMTTTYIAN